MLNFEFYNPTKIIFGAETIARLTDLVPAKASVLILYGGSSAKKNGTLDEIKIALGSRVFQEFGGIEPNPSYETLMPAVEMVRREKIDYLLAVGGGVFQLLDIVRGIHLQREDTDFVVRLRFDCPDGRLN